MSPIQWEAFVYSYGDLNVAGISDVIFWGTSMSPGPQCRSWDLNVGDLNVRDLKVVAPRLCAMSDVLDQPFEYF